MFLIPGREDARILAWALTEIQSGKRCGVVLLTWRGEYVTAWYREGDREWSHGHHYAAALKDMALRDFVKRIDKPFATAYVTDA